MTQFTMEDLLVHLEMVLSKQFSRSVSKIYFGDIGVYLPEAFGSSRKEQKAVIALSPSYNRPLEDQRNAAAEYRILGVDIITLVNITPFFKANPEEAYGERMLVRLTTEIAQFLTQEANVTLGGGVQHSKVGAIDWGWQTSDNQALRGASINFEARVRVDRQLLQR